MAFEEIKENFVESDARVRSYIDLSKEYYQLKGFKFLMHGVTALSKLLMVLTAGMMALLFLSIAASYGIGQSLDNTSYGFLCVGLFYMVLGIIAYALRNKLNKPILRKFSDFYFEDDDS
jgi:hypothetical protein